MKSTLKAPSHPPHSTVTAPIAVASNVSAALKCAICQYDMDHRNEQLVALECGHVFHQCCIDQAVHSTPCSNFSNICPHKCWGSKGQWTRIPIGNDAATGGAANSSLNPVTELEAASETLEHDAAVDPSLALETVNDATVTATAAPDATSAPDDTTEAAEAAATAPVDID